MALPIAGLAAGGERQAVDGQQTGRRLSAAPQKWGGSLPKGRRPLFGFSKARRKLVFKWSLVFPAAISKQLINIFLAFVGGSFGETLKALFHNL